MVRKFDFLVIGSGIAGMSFALKVAHKGTVALICKAGLEEANTYFAQGGIASVTNLAVDNFDKHIEDTMIAGDWISDRAAVEKVVRNAPGQISELIKWGVNFDKKDNGEFDLHKEGGHSEFRILHHKDNTGAEIQESLIEAVKQHPNITVFTNFFAVEIITQHHLGIIVTRYTPGIKCYGAYVLNENTGEVDTFLSKVTIMATGGCEAVYRNTTNPLVATGDGIAMVYRAKGAVKDMEFIQFHPTGLYTETDHAFLISEAVRGEGAILLNDHDEPFMKGRHPLADLAPRDVVAREIFREMRRSGASHVRLSLRHLDPERIRHRFPTITAYLDSLGIDITQEIPVAPAAHYTVGGIATDLEGHTSLPGLYAVGEAASTGVMGANRLASNSLIECLVYGKRVAERAEGDPIALTDLPEETTPAWDRDRSIEWYRVEGKPIEEKCARLMTAYCGIIRRGDELRRLIMQLGAEEERIRPLVGENVYALMTLRRLHLSTLIARSALSREESRGCHYREDFTATKPQGSVFHTLIDRDDTIRQEPVAEE